MSSSPASTPHRMLTGQASESTFELRLSIFICRCFIFVFSLGRLIYTHGKHIVKDVKARRFIRVGPLAVPSYLSNWQDFLGFTLMILLVSMLCMEPIVHCLGKDGPIFDEHCEEAERLLLAYSIASGVALWCYYPLPVDRLVLVCGRLLSEVRWFLFGVSILVVAFPAQ